MMPQTAQAPGLSQLLAMLSAGGSPQAGPPTGDPMAMMGGGPPEAAEGEGGQNPLIALLMQLLAGQGGMPGMPPAMAGGGMGMPQGGGY